MSKDKIEELKLRLRKFVTERDWDKFQSPKNLSMALIAEAAELAEHFQWLTEQESTELPPEQLKKVELELADVFIYLIRLADELNVELLSAANTKIALNKEKYPIKEVRG